MMTLEQFKEIPAGEIFRVVTTKYHHFQRVNGQWPELTFVCKKGEGYDDWAIYAHYPTHDIEWIADYGDKLADNKNIYSIFPCSDEVLALYRY